jgi:hypothetical protein
MNAEVTNQWAHKILILQEKAQKQCAGKNIQSKYAFVRMSYNFFTFF